MPTALEWFFCIVSSVISDLYFFEIIVNISSSSFFIVINYFLLLLLFLLFLTIFFGILIIESKCTALVLPQASTPYIKYGNKELYKCVNVFLSKKFLIIYNMPLDLVILFFIYTCIMYKFHFNLSFIITVRYFVGVTREVILS